MRLLTQKDHPLDYIVLALPTDLYQRCRAVDYVEKGVGHVHRDLRRAFKAMAMQYQKPTQILLDSTTGLTDNQRDLDHPSVVAWNLFTGLYFKIDGLPWGPTSLPPGTCFIGISFFRPLGESSTLRTSVVQAFDENGEGLVLRGHRFHWDERRQGRSPHLTADMAESLIEMVMERYKAEQKQLPRRVVIHKTSRFEPQERSGFDGALTKRGCYYDLVSLSPNSGARLRSHPIVRRKRRQRRSRTLVRPARGSQACLFSGGLDSLIGAIDCLEVTNGEPLCLVGHHDPNIGGVQKDQEQILEVLRTLYPNRCRPILVGVGHSGKSAEITMRSRSVLFVALGIVIAAHLGDRTPLLIPENGTIALNVPLTPSRRGSCSTRTAHPHYLALLQDWLDGIGLAHPLQNPLLDKTKGEAGAQCLNQAALKKTALLSCSCAKRGHTSSWVRRTAR